MTARADGAQIPVNPRRLRDEPHRAAHGRARGHVLGPDQVRPLARHGHPAARITHDIDQRSLQRRLTSESRITDQGYPPPPRRPHFATKSEDYSVAHSFG